MFVNDDITDRCIWIAQLVRQLGMSRPSRVLFGKGQEFFSGIKPASCLVGTASSHLRVDISRSLKLTVRLHFRPPPPCF